MYRWPSSELDRAARRLVESSLPVVSMVGDQPFEPAWGPQVGYTTECERPNILQSLALLSVASRFVEPTRPKRVNAILRKWVEIRKLPAHERSLYSICCKACAPYLSAGHRTRYIGGHFGVDISSLNTECVFCDIIRQTFLHYVGTTSPQNRCKVAYGRKGDIQLCFYNSEDRRNYYNSIPGEHVHIQLYSSEARNRRNPFRFAHNIALDPTNSLALVRIKNWINDCVDNHEQCAAAAPQNIFIPSRLIKVEDNALNIVHLASPTQPVRFAALSYCWGKGKQHITTKNNVRSRYHHFAISELPKTIQDALIMTRALGLGYLWVDSICIVQDDEEDWDTEASRMADLYSGAWIVLAATQAPDSAAGFLDRRTKYLTIQSKGKDPCPFKVRARRVGNYDCFLAPKLDHFPLFKRAWCMQERLLARRLVHFLPDELYYECQVTHEGECGAVPGREFSSHCSAFRSLLLTESLKGTKTFHFGQMWAQIIEEYSTLRLTYDKDILPALSGLARSMGHLSPGKYICGIWEKDISYQLGWSRKLSTPEAAATEREHAYPQPTFSWTNSLGAVEFDADNRGVYSPLCDMLEPRCDLASADPYGRIVNASVCLRGPIVYGPELISELDKTFFDIDFGNPVVHLDVGIRSICRSCCNSRHYQGWDSVSDWDSVICFGLCYWTWDAEHQYVNALLLQRTPRDREYIRLGFVSNLPKPWFDQHAFPKKLTLH
ncbi:uncharacterized protein A1O5_10337 [Cladophialophora psammophila CBS 110553]|uniref:Heterokaryon incompatibility domain-containing protein n=1 Tax=Cladophialophora psammophila CBS 110553 TaxID=1182543 RepID=W9WPR1_9EURO|nr:uncharacterized protein A1O5_10337 [Cladophialophora psammophila CBS 110553]EXJ66666.1 hypothetical protein A1O5_10337 [Cladophialophora psammophila CBS 110553]